MIIEGIKNLLGEDLTKQVETALKGKGKDGKDVDLVIGNDGSFVPAEKYNGANSGKTSAENALKAAAEDFAIFHGVRVYSSINLPVTSEATSDSKTKTTTVHAIAMIEGAIAQPAVIYPYKEPEKIPLSNDYGVSMFFDYGTKALTPDLIFWYGTSVTA